ncbi:PAS domain-containing protein [Sinorhizobium meliloti]|uniref:PAS domain-containing protein n=1 Tax=Rhizobium meliloti TaxID=382 RepID=UPI000377F42D|nr:PAS domain-containing protein [Sinorhizobium meliloti]UDU21352.1 PAS domain-containing protein [Sinorhizobium meliloti]
MMEIDSYSDAESKLGYVLQAMGFTAAQAGKLSRRMRDGMGAQTARKVLQRALGAPDRPILDGVIHVLELQRGVRRMSETAGLDADEVSSLFDTIVRQALAEAGPNRLGALEATSQGFAELDGRGRVRWHNPSLGRLLGRSSLVGETVFAWFWDGDQLTTRFEELASDGGGTIKHRRFTLECADRMRQVDVEICVAGYRGAITAYLFVRDASAHLEAQERAFAAADFGAVRTGSAGEIISCNQHIARRLGVQPADVIGCRVRDLVANEEDRALVDRELERRERGEASTFIVGVRVQGAAAPRHVRVVAFPEFDEDGTTRIATLAFARMIEPEHICQTLHAKMAEVIDVRQRVELIHTHIAPLVPHDSLVFSICDDTGAWSWSAHVVPRPNPPWATRWFPISEAMRRWSLAARDAFGNILIEDVPHWYQMLPPEELLRDDPTVQGLIGSGVRSSLSVPVVLGDRIIASISLMRTTDPPFDDVESSYLFNMQLRETVLNLALQYSRQEREFLNELHRVVSRALSVSDGSSISAATDRSRHQSVGELVTRQLCEFYRWRAVEIFEVDVTERVFLRLAACEWVNDSVVAPSTSAGAVRKPFEAGLLGRAYANGEIRHHPPRTGLDRPNAPEEVPFEGSHAWAKSAISLPVKLKGRVVWIINIEDDRVDAFNAQEQMKLTQFVEHIQGALERLYMESLLGAVFDNASDVILVVDPDGRICFANERAAMVLRTTSAALAGQALVDLLLDSDDAARLLGPSRIRDVRCALRRPNDEQPSYVIASAASWQNAFGLKIVYATELDAQSWHVDLQVIEGALAQVARQSNESIMRLYGCVQRLPEVAHNVNLEKEKKRIEKHLAEVKLTYDRIRKHLPSNDKRYGQQKVRRVDLAQLPLRAARDVAPNVQPKHWVKFVNRNAPCVIAGRQDDLVFVVRSILDYLRSRKADESHVRVELRTDRSVGAVTLEFTAATDLPAPPEGPFETAFASGVEMVAIGTGALRRIIEDEHGGQFTHIRRHNDEAEVFTLTLPWPADAGAEGRVS